MNKVTIQICAENDIITARSEGRRIALEIGFSKTKQVMIATAISELVRNIRLYAGQGTLCIETLNSDTRKGLKITASDEGPGIENIALALQDGYSTSGGLGLGLPGTKRLMDEFFIESKVGSGTTVITVIWVN